MFRPMLLFPALLALVGCGQPPAQTDADPALWVVRDADTTIYLFGTVHVLKPRLSWFDGAVRDAFDRSDQLALELVAPPEAEMSALVRELGIADDGEVLAEQIPPATMRKLHDALDELGRPLNSLDRAEPWYAAVTVAQLPVRELGYDPAAGVEETLADAAAKAKKPVIGLETAREQLGYFDRLSPRAQRAMLIAVLDGLPEAAGRLDAAINAWSKGDPDALAALINEDLKSAPEVQKALITDRNARWAGWIEARLRAPGTVFVAVGAGHLAGPRSVQAELARRGIKVARINY